MLHFETIFSPGRPVLIQQPCKFIGRKYSAPLSEFRSQCFVLQKSSNFSQRSATHVQTIPSPHSGDTRFEHYETNIEREEPPTRKPISGKRQQQQQQPKKEARNKKQQTTNRKQEEQQQPLLLQQLEVQVQVQAQLHLQLHQQRRQQQPHACLPLLRFV